MPGASPVHDALIRLIPRLRRYARLLRADPHAADDLVQDTLERACARLAQWRPDSDLRAWAFTIMHNLHVSETRRPRHRFESTAPYGDGPSDDCRRALPHGDEVSATAAVGDAPAEAARDPSGAWIAALDLERALRALPAAQRQVLMLVVFEDLTYEQTASVLGVPVGTVMSRLSRARAQLRALLEPGAPSGRGAAPRLRVLK